MRAEGGPVAPETASPRAALADAGAYVLDAADRRLSGWVRDDADAAEALALAVICGGQLAKVVVADAAPPAGAPAGARGFLWQLPAPIWAAGGALRVIELARGTALAGPAELPRDALRDLAPVAGASGPDWGAAPRGWPLGLAGPLEARINPLTEDVHVLADPQAVRPWFARAEGPAAGDLAGPPGPGWAVRVEAEAAADWTVLQRLPAAAAGLAATTACKLWVRLTRASSNITFVPADVFLSRRDGQGFQTLRRLRLTRVTRPFCAIAFQPVLEDEERALAAEGRLWLGLSVAGVPGLEVCPVVPAAEPAGGGFEDGRLAATFAACARPPEPPPAMPAGDAGLTDIIVPVYNGAETVLRCLKALQAATDTPFRVQVVDDGSRAYTTRLLEQLVAGDGRFHLHRRAANRGYTKSVNEGLRLTRAPWVVILNSDTVVSSGWLGRLHRALAAVPGAGLAGPLSNAASWQSVPQVKTMDGRWSQNDFIGPDQVEQVQARLAAVSRRGYPLFPLLNGFCTLFSRAVFERCGDLDEDAFPLGYGEETDLCLRARAAGFKAVVADDCFVYHEKSVSFGSATRAGLTRQGGFELKNKHPGVNIAALEEVMRSDPVMAALRLDLAGLPAELEAELRQ
ncbi:glycosyltransferase family 2 protein [Xanthobacter sp. V4C-4]|uniref:glycosyltransferase family 2 protein n=1 Tax=Xanthobacter cornucopiae TaxID=3119924 RepID=UPI00372C1A37